MDVLATLCDALVFILPSYVANGTPVVMTKIVKRGKPLDLGLNFIDGRRVFGDGKTVEGFISGLLMGTLVGMLLSRLGLKESFLLSLGAMLGDLVGSFIKRRIGLERGAPLPPLDQLDFIAGSLLLYSWFVKVVPLNIVMIVLGLTPPLHLLTNFIAYKLGLKSVPW